MLTFHQIEDIRQSIANSVFTAQTKLDTVRELTELGDASAANSVINLVQDPYMSDAIKALDKMKIVLKKKKARARKADKVTI